MPRPKRSKVAPSAPTAIFPHKLNTKSAVPSHVSSPRSTRTTTNSDDSEGLVKRNTTGRNSRGIARQEIMMSGALPPSSDSTTTRRKPITGKERTALSRAARQSPRSVKAKGSPARDVVPVVENAPEIHVPASHPDETFASSSPNSVESNPQENVFASAMKRPQSSAGFNWRTQATPQADSSAIMNFKRRPRQPSILGIGRATDSPSINSLGDLGDDKSVDGEGEASRLARLDFTIYDDLSDFEPDNESTPFGVAKAKRASNIGLAGRRTITRSPSATSSPALVTSRRPVREATLADSSFEGQRDEHSSVKKSNSISLRGNGTGKRKITPQIIQVPQSQQSPVPSIEGSKDDTHNSESLLNRVDDDIELPSPKRQAVAQPDIWSDTMAPPQSSTPERSQPSQKARSPSPTMQNAVRGRGRTRRTQISQPSTTAQSVKKSTLKQSSKPVSTEALQALLPRRRTRKARGEFDIHSDGTDPSPAIDEDEDELSYMGPGRRKTTRRVPNSNKRDTIGKAKSAKTVRKQSRATAPTAASAAKAKTKSSASLGTSTKPTRTYSRRTSDKENLPQDIILNHSYEGNDSLLPDESGDTSYSSIVLPREAQRELDKVAQKFKEIDNWEMEFEEVTASSSSPKDAR